jgi:hypothetical protein
MMKIQLRAHGGVDLELAGNVAEICCTLFRACLVISLCQQDQPYVRFVSQGAQMPMVERAPVFEQFIPLLAMTLAIPQVLLQFLLPDHQICQNHDLFNTI